MCLCVYIYAYRLLKEGGMEAVNVEGCDPARLKLCMCMCVYVYVRVYVRVLDYSYSLIHPSIHTYIHTYIPDS
jgi:hypothetical protein